MFLDLDLTFDQEQDVKSLKKLWGQKYIYSHPVDLIFYKYIF